MADTPTPAEGEARIRKALWASLAVVLLVAVVVVAALVFRQTPTTEDGGSETNVVGPTTSGAQTVNAPPIPFTDITTEAGIDFVHENGAFGERLLPETMGGGIAFFDYDNDGDQDLLLIDSGQWPWREGASPAHSRLYRNRGDGTFQDQTDATALALPIYGMGVAVGDYDGDGFVDIYVTAVGGNRLLRNVGGERFVDVTEATGVAGADDAWSTCATFFDYDRDGDLDLFVCNYVVWSPEIDRAVDFRLTGIGRAYGPPTDFAGTHSVLYRNDDGQFVDVSAMAGIQVPNPATGLAMGKALAVLPHDVDHDGWPDLVVANDTVRNFLFINQRDGRFFESGIDSGLAFDTTGAATGAMGIDAAHYDNDGKLAIAIGNFANEMSSFYVSLQRDGEHSADGENRQQVFSDDAIVAGIGAASRLALTFGLVFFDADLDGRLDLLAANGHVEPAINRVQASQRYAQQPQLFWNCADCRRRFVVADAVGDLAQPLVGRGAAYADIDGDGDLDIALTQAGAAAVLLRNDQQLGNHWLRIELQGVAGNLDGLGSRVVLGGQTVQRRTATPSRSYLSQVEAPLTFGLGKARAAESVTVVWPDGSAETWRDLAAGTHTLRAGSGEPR